VRVRDKVAVIYGGGAAVGGAVVRAFAREGATLHLAGRTKGPSMPLPTASGASGGAVATAVVDADERAV
jgi:NADP-dependent 3-hydroxy acid dehydrogenase YdfG